MEQPTCSICGAPTQLVESVIPIRLGDRAAPRRAWWECSRPRDHDAYEAYRDANGVLHYRRRVA